MKRAVVTAYCDISSQHGKTLVPATREDVTISWDGIEAQLDLCDPCYKATTDVLSVFIDIGSPVKPKFDRRDTHYYERLRAWADKHGINYIGADGKTKFRPEVKRQFDEYERAQTVSA